MEEEGVDDGEKVEGVGSNGEEVGGLGCDVDERSVTSELMFALRSNLTFSEINLISDCRARMVSLQSQITDGGVSVFSVCCSCFIRPSCTTGSVETVELNK